MNRRVPASWRLSRSPLTVCAVMSDRTPSRVTSPDTDLTAVRSAAMPETTASADTTPSSTGQSAGTDTETVAEALRLPTQSSSPPQVSRSCTMVRVPFSRLTRERPLELADLDLGGAGLGVLGAADHVDVAGHHPHLQAPDALEVEGLRVLDPPLRHDVSPFTMYRVCGRRYREWRMSSPECALPHRSAVRVVCGARGSVVVVVEAGQPGGQPLDRDLEVRVERRRTPAAARPARPGETCSSPRRDSSSSMPRSVKYTCRAGSERERPLDQLALLDVVLLVRPGGRGGRRGAARRRTARGRRGRPAG